MKRVLLIIALLIVLPLAALGRTWEPAEPPANQAERSGVERLDSDAPEIWVKNREVFISTDRAVTVKVFSILGQLVSQETVPPGTYRLRLSARGVYILKAGSLTRRITI